MTNDDNEVETVWREFWLPIVAPNGVVDMEQVKKELWDFKQLMGNAAKVYGHVTRSRISNPLTVPDAVIGEADECQEDATRYAIEEFFEEGDFDGLGADTVAQLKEYMGRWFGKLPAIPLYDDGKRD